MVLAAGCSDRPLSGGPAVGETQLLGKALIADEAHGNGGAKGFFFLPPLVDNPRLTGSFVRDLPAVVRIDEIDAVGSQVLRTVATFTTTTGPDGEMVRASGAHYMVNWNTGRFELSASARYRISVLLDERRLGFIDVVIVENGQTRVVTEADHVKVGKGATLPIKFWLNRCAPVVCAAADACHQAGSCDPGTGVCSQQAKPDGSPCSDADLCTQTDTCLAGVCKGGDPVVCSTPAGCTTPAACQASTGMCTPAAGCSRCGDGLLASGEQCDDGNTISGDGCSATCTREGCGDGQLQPGKVPMAVEFFWLASTCTEEPQPITFRINGAVAIVSDVHNWTCSCFPGYSSWFLSDLSVLSLLRAGQNTFSVEYPQSLAWAAVRVYTGDTEFQDAVIFDHQGGGDAESRNGDMCGAGSEIDPAPRAVTFEVTLGEECDDGNLVSGDGCSAICGGEACGNRRTDFGEECDDGNQTSNDGCSGVCRIERCFFVNCNEDDEEEGPRNPCRRGVCNPDSGRCQQQPTPDGTSCNDRSVCTRTDTCQAGQCVGGNVMDCSAQNECQLDGSCHPVRGCEINARPNGLACNDNRGCTVGDSCLGGSCIGAVSNACFSAQVSPIDPTVPTTLADSTAFLYTGPDAVQTGLTTAIDPVRAAVIRGRLLDPAGAGLPGARVSVAGHPEYGETRTREDGSYDLAVNGGGEGVVVFERPGYLKVERRVELPWQDYRVLPDAVMTALDPQATTVLFPGESFQVARASVITDEDGSRQATLLFPPGTYARVQGTTGSELASELNVRVTEYTVGPNGPAAMPATLPANSGYTYAVELSADQALRLDADVEFTQTVFLYVENFLEFPVGWDTAVGFYKPFQHAWCPSTNGRVIQILGVENGLAILDLDGAGNPATAAALSALQLSDEERAQLALLYAPGQSLWRTPVDHFSTADVNPPFGFPKGFTSPSPGTPETQQESSTTCLANGSILECENQTLGQELPITGTPLSLSYRSRLTAGNAAARTVRLPLEPLRPTALTPLSVQLQLTVAGRVSQQRFFRGNFPRNNPVFDLQWDGLDAYGRKLQGAQKANIDVGYSYEILYRQPAEIDEAFSQWSGFLPNITLQRAAATFTLTADPSQSPGAAAAPHLTLGNLRAAPQDLGGWTLSGHHHYDPAARVLYTGEGTLTSAADVSRVVTFIAGNGTSSSDRVEGTAFEISVGFVQEIAAAPNGDIYFHDGTVIRKLDPQGNVTIVRYHFDGGGIQSLVVGADGALYYTRMHLREIVRDGNTIAGNFFGGTGGENVPATQASLAIPMGVAPAPDGSVYIADTLHNKIRKVTPCGFIRTVVGTGVAGTSPDGTPAAQALIDRPHKIAVGPDGTLYWGEEGRIRMVRADGELATLAGNGVPGFSGDGGPALQAQLRCGLSCRMVFGRAGTIFIADVSRVREIGADGIITTVAGTGNLGEMKNRESALAGPVWGDISVLPDGRLVVAQAGPTWRLARLESPLPGYEGKETLLMGPDQRLLVFSREGRHLRSQDSATGTVLERFEYDPAGRLQRRIDGAGLVTTIERDATGRPAVIVAPGGQRTTLGTDANGFLNRVANPAGEAFRFTYDGQGLMQTMLDPKGNEHRFRFDSAGRLIEDSDPAGGMTTFSRTGGPRDFTVERTTALGRSSRYKVERRRDGSRKRTVTASDGLSDVEEYDANGVRTTTAADGSRGRLVREPDPRFGYQAPVPASGSFVTPAGLTSTVSLTRTVATRPDGFLQSQSEVLTQNGRSTQRTFDVASSTWTEVSPGGRQHLVTVNAAGQRVREQLGNLEPLSYQYDARGRLISMAAGTGAAALITRLEYDARDRIALVTDPAGRQTQYGYDDADRPVLETEGGIRQTTREYDDNGNMTAISPPSRPAHRFDFNTVDRITGYLPAGSAASSVIGYNVDRQPTSLSVPGTAGLTLGYDGAGRLSTLDYLDGAAPRTVNHVYNPLSGHLADVVSIVDGTVSYGRDGTVIKSITSAGHVAGQAQYTHDADARVASETVSGSGTVAFGRDADGLLVQAGGLSVTRDPASGLVTGTTLGGVSDLRTLDGFAQLRAYQANSPAGQVVAITYGRDGARRLSRKVEQTPSGTTVEDYDYDAAGRLWQVTRDGQLAATYLYDANGNRLSRATPTGADVGVYDLGDQLVSYGGWQFTYTQAGQLATRRHVATGALTSYTYDVFGSLRQVDLPDGRRIEYRLDPEGRRVAKVVDGAVVRRWLYGAHHVPVAELDGSGVLISRTVFGPDAGTFYLQTPSGDFRVITDQLGSTRFVLAVSTGLVTQQLSYDEFGVVLGDSGPRLTSVGFAGGLYDPDTGLVRFGLRDYDPRIGRWLQRDPAHFRGGDTNLYAYVANDPVNLLDPLGLDFITFDGAALVWNFETKGKVTSTRVFPAYSGGSPNADGSIAKRITEGTYSTSPRREQEIQQLGLSEDDWGPLRFRLFPDAATQRRIAADGRQGGFYIHGGTVKGTHGCVEMSEYDRAQKNLFDFADLLKDYGRSIQVRVQYPRVWIRTSWGGG